VILSFTFGSFKKAESVFSLSLSPALNTTKFPKMSRCRFLLYKRQWFTAPA
jgi:hypothetical protein